MSQDPHNMLPAVAADRLHRTNGMWRIGDTCIVTLRRKQRWWLVSYHRDGKAWISQHGLTEASFATRREAVRTMRALHAVSPARSEMPAGVHVRLRRQPDGSYLDDTNTWRVVPVVAGNGKRAWRLRRPSVNYGLGSYVTLRAAQHMIALSRLHD